MTKKILIVDDERDILNSVKLLVNSLGFQAEMVDNGKACLEKLKKEKFDLVILDMLMPGMSGREVLETIRKNSKTKNQKVAFLTVVQLGQYGEKFISKLKPVAYFQKPIVNITDFKNKLKTLLE
jgi:CheY-like chemotaxis protein